MKNHHKKIVDFVRERNSEKMLFTPGPAALLPENIIGLGPCFGRGDEDYDSVEFRVMEGLKKKSGHSKLVRMQGSASLAIEVMTLNYLYGRVLIIQSGYYSDRLLWLANSARRRIGEVKEVIFIQWDMLEYVTERFDWVVACYTETSFGLKIPIEILRRNADRLSASLMIDATASIGLENGHELAEVISYSSCKGLFGLTGAAFVAYHNEPTVEVDSFYLSLSNHFNKMMTGPYSAIASLDLALKKHDEFLYAVVENKKVFMAKMEEYLTQSRENQPTLCTHVSRKVRAIDPRAILYTPRSSLEGSIICHLGEVHLGLSARGEIINALEFL